MLKQELATLGSIDTQHLGGVHPIAEMLNAMDKASEQGIIARVEEKDKNLADEIRKLMFVFEDIVYIDDRGMQTLLKDVPNDRLIIALKTAPDEIKEKIFKNISKRAADLLREDLASLGPLKLSEVELAQQDVIAIAKKLEGEGKIVISRGTDGDSIV